MPKLVAHDLSKEDFEKMTAPRTSSSIKTFPEDGHESGKKVIVSFFGLFRFANAFDWLCITIAVLASFVTGYCQIHLIVAWGAAIAIAGEVNDSQSKEKQREENLENLMLFIYIGIIAGTCAWVYTSLFKITGYRQGSYWRKTYLEAVLRQDISWFDRENPGELPTKIAEKTQQLEEGLSSKLGEGAMFTAQFFGGIVVGFYYAWDVALVAVATAPPCTFGLYYMTKVSGEVAALLADAYSKAGGVASGSLFNMRTVSSLQCEESMAMEYERHLDAAKAAGETRAKKIGFANGLLFATGNFQTGATLLYVALKTAKEIRDSDNYTVTSEAIYPFIAMFVVQQAAQALGGLGPMVKALSTAMVAASDILETVQRVAPINHTQKGREPSAVNGEIVFEGVAFAYPSRSSSKVYSNLNLTVEAGTTVALVGSSGSGKSTAVQLMERFYDPDGGRVMLDGVDLKELSVKWLRQQIALVGQEPVLFTGTIFENIARGKERATKSQVIEAAKMANAHSFIEEFEKGYNTDVGGGGGKLSGGQKQRIAIARAIIKNPKILLLDEATSALDNESERVVQAALDELIERKDQKRTTLIIAHRLTTVRKADKIVVLNKGSVVEQGTHEELMALGGAYVALVQAAEASSQDAEGGAITKSPSGNNLVVKAFVVDGNKQSRGGDGGDIEMGEQAKTSSEEEKKKKKQSKEDEKKIKAEEVKANKAVIKRVWGMYETEDWPLLYTGLAGACATGFINPFVGLVFVKVLRMLFLTDADEVESQGSTWCIVLIGCAVVQQLSEMSKAYGFGTIAARMTKRLRSELYRATLRQEIAFYDITPPGDLCSLLSEQVAMVPALAGEEIGRNVGFLFTLVFALGFAFGLGSPVIAAVFLAVLPMMMTGMVIEFAVLNDPGASTGEGSMGAAASTLMSELVTSVRTVASFGLESTMMNQFSEEMDKHLKGAKVKAAFSGSARAYSQSSIFIAFGFVYWVGNGMIIDGKIKGSKDEFIMGDMSPMDKLLLPIMCMFMLAAGFGAAATDATDMTKASVAGRKVFELIDRKPPIDIRAKGALLNMPGDGEIAGNIVFENVRFTYPSRLESRIYDNLNLTVEAGTTVALVGSSGSGKSTAVQLMERFYDPDGGRVMLDGVDLKDMSVQFLRDHVGLVGQEPVLFSGSILDNIALGKIGATRDEVIEAAKMANAHKFIEEFGEGYDTDVGDGGGKLSGGQKQRIAIARAIIKNPKILLLDEATSALDNESERVVQAALDELIERKDQKRTTLIIAHRLTTVRKADKIVVLNKGSVVEQGTHEELMALGGAYLKISATSK